MAEYTLRLSWPARALWENEKAHWRNVARAKRIAKQEAWGLGLQKKIPKSPDAKLHFEFHPPDRRKRDCSNMPTTQKAAIDGIAQAMGCDDEHFKVSYPTEFAGVEKGGCVIVTVTPGTVEVPLRGQVS